MNPFQPVFSKTQPNPIRLLLEHVFIRPLQTQQATQPIKPVSTQPISRPRWPSCSTSTCCGRRASYGGMSWPPFPRPLPRRLPGIRRRPVLPPHGARRPEPARGSGSTTAPLRQAVPGARGAPHDGAGRVRGQGDARQRHRPRRHKLGERHRGCGPRRCRRRQDRLVRAGDMHVEAGRFAVRQNSAGQAGAAGAAQGTRLCTWER
jgi:hypothetical protein